MANSFVLDSGNGEVRGMYRAAKDLPLFTTGIRRSTESQLYAFVQYVDVKPRIDKEE